MDAQEHFDGRYEVEEKFRDVNLAELRQKLAELGAIPFIERGSETDIYFDRGEGELSAKNQAFVLRELRPSGRVLIISKGPEPDACSALETKGFDQAVELFEGLGYREIRLLEKQRDVYFLGDCHITLDDVAPFGQFAEVAIMVKTKMELTAAREKVQHTIGLLGLDHATVETRSYAEMFDELPD